MDRVSHSISPILGSTASTDNCVLVESDLEILAFVDGSVIEQEFDIVQDLRIYDCFDNMLLDMNDSFGFHLE